MDSRGLQRPSMYTGSTSVAARAQMYAHSGRIDNYIKPANPARANRDGLKRYFSANLNHLAEFIKFTPVPTPTSDGFQDDINRIGYAKCWEVVHSVNEKLQDKRYAIGLSAEDANVLKRLILNLENALIACQKAHDARSVPAWQAATKVLMAAVEQAISYFNTIPRLVIEITALTMPAEVILLSKNLRLFTTEVTQTPTMLQRIATFGGAAPTTKTESLVEEAVTERREGLAEVRETIQKLRTKMQFDETDNAAILTMGRTIEALQGSLAVSIAHERKQAVSTAAKYIRDKIRRQTNLGENMPDLAGLCNDIVNEFEYGQLTAYQFRIQIGQRAQRNINDFNPNELADILRTLELLETQQTAVKNLEQTLDVYLSTVNINGRSDTRPLDEVFATVQMAFDGPSESITASAELKKGRLAKTLFHANNTYMTNLVKQDALERRGQITHQVGISVANTATTAAGAGINPELMGVLDIYAPGARVARGGHRPSALHQRSPQRPGERSLAAHGAGGARATDSPVLGTPERRPLTAGMDISPAAEPVAGSPLPGRPTGFSATVREAIVNAASGIRNFAGVPEDSNESDDREAHRAASPRIQQNPMAAGSADSVTSKDVAIGLNEESKVPAPQPNQLTRRFSARTINTSAAQTGAPDAGINLLPGTDGGNMNSVTPGNNENTAMNLRPQTAFPRDPETRVVVNTFAESMHQRSQNGLTVATRRVHDTAKRDKAVRARNYIKFACYLAFIGFVIGVSVLGILGLLGLDGKGPFRNMHPYPSRNNTGNGTSVTPSYTPWLSASSSAISTYTGLPITASLTLTPRVISSSQSPLPSPSATVNVSNSSSPTSSIIATVTATSNPNGSVSVTATVIASNSTTSTSSPSASATLTTTSTTTFTLLPSPSATASLSPTMSISVSASASGVSITASPTASVSQTTNQTPTTTVTISPSGTPTTTISGTGSPSTSPASSVCTTELNITNANVNDVFPLPFSFFGNNVSNMSIDARGLDGNCLEYWWGGIPRTGTITFSNAATSQLHVINNNCNSTLAYTARDSSSTLCSSNLSISVTPAGRLRQLNNAVQQSVNQALSWYDRLTGKADELPLAEQYRLLESRINANQLPLGIEQQRLPILPKAARGQAATEVMALREQVAGQKRELDVLRQRMQGVKEPIHYHYSA